MKKELQIVKKTAIVVAILFAGALVAQANISTITESDEIPVVVQNEDEFVVINFEDLSSEVQAAINGECEKNGCKVKTVARHKENNDLKVVVVCAEDAEEVYLFDETGKRKEK